MSKNKKNVSKSAADSRTLLLCLRRDHKVGEDYCKAGTVIGEVHLPVGVELNFLVDAVRNGLAGEMNEASDGS